MTPSERAAVAGRIDRALRGQPPDPPRLEYLYGGADLDSLDMAETDEELIEELTLLIEELADLLVADGAASQSEPVEDLWERPEWLEIVRHYRASGDRRPGQLKVAGLMGFETEQPLRDRLRSLGITDWRRTVHAQIAAGPPAGSRARSIGF